jgi:hypothetical protein
MTGTALVSFWGAGACVTAVSIVPDPVLRRAAARPEVVTPATRLPPTASVASVALGPRAFGLLFSPPSWLLSLLPLLVVARLVGTV